RVYRCGASTPLALKVTVTDALGEVTTTHPLARPNPPPDPAPGPDPSPSQAHDGGNGSTPDRLRESGFTDLVVELPVAPDHPFQLELELVARDDTSPDRSRPRRERQAPGGLVALIDPTLSGFDLDANETDTNVLWIVIDAVRHDAMGPGRAFSPSASPELDRRVFARGTSFTHAYALANQTRTSTVAMLASVPASIGGFHSHSWSFTSGKRETFYQRDPDLVTRLLSRHGFLTRHIGHNHFIWGSEVIGIDHGFQRALDIRAIPQDATLATRAATRFFRRHRDSRWMLMLNYTAPHTPYKPPEAFLEKARALTSPPSSERIGWLPRSYLGEILWVDHNLEQVFAELERLDLLEDTLVIVTADHGEVMNPAHDCSSALLSQPCGYNHGVTVYDDELRVPLAFALPRRVTPGRVVSTPISHADLGPTILEVLGLPPARRHVGRSLYPALSGGHVAAEAIYADGRLAAAFMLNELKLIMMCEIPSNAVLANDYLQYFDGFSIGSNDLTQLTLGVDRDSSDLADLFDESDAA
ncbi:MAG TPA: sulfatase-like hydrolase/transferase, partial [Myxococcota bacterium]|nr:sulfatase-like hydrolase/transferase [Myxococcota bacterium]